MSPFVSMQRCRARRQQEHRSPAEAEEYSPALIQKFVKFADLIDKPLDDAFKLSDAPLNQSIVKYRDLSSEKTTDATRRIDRQKELIKAIGLL